jgi:adenosylcobinamide-GDP ribazoletransferase
MRRFLAAMRFLTVIPFPVNWGTDESSLVGSTVFFPVVGLLIGLVAAGIAACAARWLPGGLAAALVIVALLAVSGGLHMDGLSDTADGLLSARPRERALEIMRDSHVGAMGVIAVVSALMLKFAAMASLPAAELWRTALLMPIAGRAALVVTIALLPYARPEGGLAAPFYRRRSMLAAVWAEVFLFVAAWLVLDVAGLVAACASLAAVLIFSVYTYRRIGGATGDTLGAACEIAELVPAVAMAAWYFHARGPL